MFFADHSTKNTLKGGLPGGTYLGPVLGGVGLGGWRGWESGGGPSRAGPSRAGAARRKHRQAWTLGGFWGDLFGPLGIPVGPVLDLGDLG